MNASAFTVGVDTADDLIRRRVPNQFARGLRLESIMVDGWMRDV